MAHKDSLTLPAAVVGLPEIARLLRELDNLHEQLHQAALRKTAKADLKLPATSLLLQAILKANDLDIFDRQQHDWLQTQLTALKKDAPQLHIAFSTQPSAPALQKIVEWFRHNIHPQALVHVGLEPNLAAGCLLRTTNHQFDLSLKEHFSKSRPLLVDALKAGAEVKA